MNMKRYGVKLMVAVGAAATAVMISVGVAGAAVGSPFFSPEQAGFAATGAHFRFVQSTVTLPDASNFSSEVAGFGLSVHLWSNNRVVVLGVSNSTTSGPYSAAVAVYNRTTHALICSTAAPTPCAGVPANWTDGTVNFPAGDVVTSSIFYDRAAGTTRFRVVDQTTMTTLTYTRSMSGQVWRQARVGAEFSPISPWRMGFTFNPPANVVRLATFRNCALTTTSGLHTSFFAPWVRHKIFMTSTGTVFGTDDAAPGDLFNGGRNFGVFLLPWQLRAVRHTSGGGRGSTAGFIRHRHEHGARHIRTAGDVVTVAAAPKPGLLSRLAGRLRRRR